MNFRKKKRCKVTDVIALTVVCGLVAVGSQAYGEKFKDSWFISEPIAIDTLHKDTTPVYKLTATTTQPLSEVVQKTYINKAPYSMKQWVWDLCKQYGDKEKLPKEVWYPIVMMESGGSTVSTMITKKEHSIGLLQVNTLVHPVKRNEMYDPEKNLAYQMPELAEKYREAKEMGLSGLSVVYYVERYGQRCNWTETVKTTLKKYYEEVTK